MISLVPDEMPDPAPYRLLTSVVAPRPIAWVSSISSEGVPNLAPYSFFNAVAGFPPVILFSLSYRRKEPREKDTLRNVRETGEFVCNVVNETTAEAMVKSAADWPYGTSEFEAVQVEAASSVDVAPPRVAQAPVAMECKVTQIIPVEGATNVMVLGRVVRFHIQEELYLPEQGLVDTRQMRPVMRLGGPVLYTKIGELFELEIPQM
ncbi:flavin reductase family protein [Leptolyngbya sp. AN02str]|uniref:flavin reductase family protein n=1 Tax=Leptolyngbya sp. AN02str TaxID=3423363 RepID=UPI003D311806